MSEATRGGDPSQTSADPLGLPGVLVLHVLQSQISGRRLPHRRRETGEEEKRERRGGGGKKRQHTNIVAKLSKNGLKSPGVTTQLNCESGITLYIKKKTKRKRTKTTISLYLLSLFSPSVLIYDLV